MSKLTKFLLGRPVIIASHASPAHRGKVGEVIALAGGTATVRLKTPRRSEDVAIPLEGLRLIRRPEAKPPKRSFLSMLIPSAARAALSPSPRPSPARGEGV